MSQAVGASADAKQRNRRARELRHPKNFIKVHKRAKTRKLAETSACFEVYKLYRFIEKSCSSQTQCVLIGFEVCFGSELYRVKNVHYLSTKIRSLSVPPDSIRQ